MDNKKDLETYWLGNYFGFTGKSYDGWVVNKIGISFTLLACMCNGNVPKIIVKKQVDKNKKI